MRYVIPKNSSMLVCHWPTKTLRNHVCKHIHHFDANDEITSDDTKSSLTFTFSDTTLIASNLMSARFRMFATGNRKFPYLFVAPEFIINASVLGEEDD